MNPDVTFTGNGSWTAVASDAWRWFLLSRPSAGDDDDPPTGVREPRRPHPSAPAGAAAVELVPA